MTAQATPVLTKQRLFLALGFLVLFLGFYANLWKVVPDEYFNRFDECSESLAIGRIARSEKEGVFSHGGLPGVNYDATKLQADAYIWLEVYPDQKPYYLADNVPDDYDVYKSQTGGHLISYGIIQKILPSDNALRLQVFHFINALLSALCFTLFLGWIFRNFGFVAALFVLVLIALSSWITLFGNSLWWSLWGAYIPFIVMLLVLEYNHRVKKLSPNKILLYLFISVFAKCVFNGYEFISTLLVATMCPFILYAFVERQKLKSFIFFFLKASATSIAAVVLQMIILITQIKFVMGSFGAGIDYIITSYTRRSFSADDEFANYTYSYIFKRYLKGNAFNFDFLEQHSIVIYFAYVILVVLIMAAVVYFLSRGLDDARKRFNMALLVTTAVSSLAPLSWFVVFKQHAANHFHLDYIVWYMPFLLFGFVIIGEGISLILQKIGVYKRGLIDGN